jgi:hypothetical protein
MHSFGWFDEDKENSKCIDCLPCCCNANMGEGVKAHYQEVVQNRKHIHSYYRLEYQKE